MKFKKKSDGGDADGNWSYVNGHQILFEIIDIETVEGEPNSDKSLYATFAPQRANGTALSSTSVDGAATVILKAESQIGDAKTITLKAYDQSQWQQ